MLLIKTRLKMPKKEMGVSTLFQVWHKRGDFEYIEIPNGCNIKEIIIVQRNRVNSRRSKER